MSEEQSSSQANQRFTATVEKLKSELDRIVDFAWTKGGEAYDQLRSQNPDADWIPEVDLVETEESLIAFINLPGIDPEAINFTLVGNTLEISGEFQSLTLQTADRVHRRERPTGAIARKVTLPFAVDQDSASASAERGVFKIMMQKTASSRPHKIQIQTSHAEV